jgi:hypothetical protein
MKAAVPSPPKCGRITANAPALKVSLLAPAAATGDPTVVGSRPSFSRASVSSATWGRP